MKKYNYAKKIIAVEDSTYTVPEYEIYIFIILKLFQWDNSAGYNSMKVLSAVLPC